MPPNTYHANFESRAPILGEQVSVGGRRWYRWIGRWSVPIGCQ